MFRDRDYIEVSNRFIFTVIGNIHPPARIISYLKYIPAKEKTPWSRDGIFYARALKGYSAWEVAKAANRYIKNEMSRYIVYDEVLGVKLIEVPNDDIVAHYIPEERLFEILGEPSDVLEEKVDEIIDILTQLSGISENSFGVTGSILLKMHSPSISDIDLIIYGYENSWRIKHLLLELINNSRYGFSRLKDKLLSDYAKRLIKFHNLSYKEAVKLYTEKMWNRGIYRETFFSIHPVMYEWEMREKYGEKKYRFIEKVSIKARISDNRYSLFNPSIYSIEDVEVEKGVKKNDIREIVSFEGLYSGIFDIDEYVYATGKLEKVYDLIHNDEYYRIVIGSAELKGDDYIKPLSWVL
jgi:hypothetical protein